MWEICEGDAKISCAMKLVPLEDLRFREPKVLETLNAGSLQILVLEDASGVSGSPKHIMHSTTNS